MLFVYEQQASQKGWVSKVCEHYTLNCITVKLYSNLKRLCNITFINTHLLCSIWGYILSSLLFKPTFIFNMVPIDSQNILPPFYFPLYVYPLPLFFIKGKGVRTIWFHVVLMITLIKNEILHTLSQKLHYSCLHSSFFPCEIGRKEGEGAGLEGIGFKNIVPSGLL